MSIDLQILAKHHGALLLAEVGAFSHNIGKSSEESLRYQAADADCQELDFQGIVGTVVELVDTLALTKPGRGRLAFYPTFFDALEVRVIDPHPRDTGAGRANRNVA